MTDHNEIRGAASDMSNHVKNELREAESELINHVKNELCEVASDLIKKGTNKLCDAGSDFIKNVKNELSDAKSDLIKNVIITNVTLSRMWRPVIPMQWPPATRRLHWRWSRLPRMFMPCEATWTKWGKWHARSMKLGDVSISGADRTPALDEFTIDN